MSFENKLLVSLGGLIVGLGLGAKVIFEWVANDFQNIAYPNLFVGSLFFVVIAAINALLALTIFTFEYSDVEK